MEQDLSIVYSSKGFEKISSEMTAMLSGASSAGESVNAMGNAMVVAGQKAKALRGPDGKFLPKGTVLDLDSASSSLYGFSGASAAAGSSLGSLRGEIIGLGTDFLKLQTITYIATEAMHVTDAMASLQAITGATGDTLAYFGERASESGRTVQGGTTAMLAGIEAIGSARPELLKDAEALADVAENAKVLAQAAGGDLAENAKAVTTSMAQFVLAADQSSRIINVLAAGSLEGAAGIGELNDGLQASGGVLNSMGVPLEESIALLEVLAANGLKGAEAGTQLRNIFATFAAGELLPKESVALMEQLGVNIEILSSKTSPTVDKLRELSKITADTAIATKIFGKESFTAATYLGNGVGLFEDLSKAVTGTNTAFEQAEIRTSTTSFQLLRLKNTAVDLGVRLFNSIAPAIEVVANLAEGLINVAGVLADNKGFLILATGAIAAYNASTIAATASTIAMGIASKAAGAYAAAQAAIMGAITTAQAAYIVVTNALAGATTLATAAQRLLNIAMASNPLGLVIAAATALGAAYYYLSGQTKKLTEVEQACADASAAVAEQFGKESANANILFTKLQNLNPASAEAKKLRDEINTTYGTYLPNQITEASNLAEIAKAQDLVTGALLRKIQAQVTEAKITEVVALKTQNLLTTTEEIGKSAGVSMQAITSAVGEFSKIIGGRSFDESAAVFEKFGYDAAALSGAMIRLGGVSGSTAATIEKINRAGLGDAFLDMAQAAAVADGKIKALTDLFPPAVDGATKTANAVGSLATGGRSIDQLQAQLDELGKRFNATSDAAERLSISAQIRALSAEIERMKSALSGDFSASGSIKALQDQLQKLSERFERTGSAIERAALAARIKDVGYQIDFLQRAAEGAPLESIERIFALGGSFTGDNFATAQQRLASAVAGVTGFGVELENSMRSADFFAEGLADSFASAERATLSLRETLLSKLGEEAFGKLTQGLEGIKGQFIDFGATVAQSIGQAIGSGDSLAEAFKNALRDLAIQVPKLAGMALLNAAATPGIGVAALPLAIAGLALLGLSGVIAGVTKDRGSIGSPSSPSLPGAPAQPQQGLGQYADRQAISFNGSTFVLSVDREEFGGAVRRVQLRDGKKRVK